MPSPHPPGFSKSSMWREFFFITLQDRCFPKRPSRGGFFFHQKYEFKNTIEDVFISSKIWIQKHTQGEAFFFFEILNSETPSSGGLFFNNQTFKEKKGLPLGVFLDSDLKKNKMPPLEGVFESGSWIKKNDSPRRCFWFQIFEEKKDFPSKCI